MKRTKLEHQQAVESQELAQTSKVEKESCSVEELLQHDAAQIVPPATIKARLKKSIAREPPPKTSWWRKIFS